MTAGSPPARILVVEDDCDTREAVIDVLEDAGFWAFGAADGLEALDYLRRGASCPELILLDLMMPNMDGYRLREEQLNDPRLATIPAVVFTAAGRAREKAALLKADGFLEKPVKARELLEMVRTVLGHRTR